MATKRETAQRRKRERALARERQARRRKRQRGKGIVYVQIEVDSEAHTSLKELAAASGKTMGEFLRDVVEERLKKEV